MKQPVVFVVVAGTGTGEVGEEGDRGPWVPEAWAMEDGSGTEKKVVIGAVARLWCVWSIRGRFLWMVFGGLLK